MSRLVLQPSISRDRFKAWVAVVVGESVVVAVGVAEGVVVGVEGIVVVDVNVNVKVGVKVRVSDGVTEAIAGNVGETGMMITVEVADGMNGGVGERIAGRGEGDTIGV
jgi:hypothetical protein